MAAVVIMDEVAVDNGIESCDGVDVDVDEKNGSVRWVDVEVDVDLDVEVDGVVGLDVLLLAKVG